MIVIIKNKFRMKKLIFLLALAIITLGSCRDQKTEAPAPSTHTKEVIREIHVETKEEPKRDGALERAAKKVDKKVNDKIDEAIDEID